MNEIREPILLNFALDKPPGQKIRPRKKLYKKIIEPFLKKIMFSVKDVKNNRVSFRGEILNFNIIKKIGSGFYKYNNNKYESNCLSTKKYY